MDSQENSSTDQLESDQVFIDTQAYVRERLDWQSKSCTRLKELVRSGHVQVLTTSITKSEVRNKIKENLANAKAALRKHDVVLSQLESTDALTATDGDAAEAKLQALFDGFLNEIKAIEVPLSKDVDRIFDSYFQERPPFSAKKKSEFPDAFVVSSLQERAKLVGRKIYVVSADPDMAACCEGSAELVKVETLAEIISMATVTKVLHDRLLSFLKDSDSLQSKLTECLLAAKVALLGGSSKNTRVHLGSVAVGSVDEINLTDLNVISQEGNKFQCLLDFTYCADIYMEFQVEMHHWDGEEDHESYDEFTTSIYHLGYHFAEIDVLYDSKAPSTASFNFISCDAEIEIDASEVDELRRFRG
jgi:PIN domain